MKHKGLTEYACADSLCMRVLRIAVPLTLGRSASIVFNGSSILRFQRKGKGSNPFRRSMTLFMFDKSKFEEIVEDMREKNLIDIVAIPKVFIDAMENESERDTDTT